jgi:hypothetical protein
MRQADRNSRYTNGGAGLSTWRTQITLKHHLARDEKDPPGILAPFRLAYYPTVDNESMVLHNAIQEMTNRPEEMSHEQSE